jgi:hypothetical protein
MFIDVKKITVRKWWITLYWKSFIVYTRLITHCPILSNLDLLMRILQFAVGNLDSVFFSGKISPIFTKKLGKIWKIWFFLV